MKYIEFEFQINPENYPLKRAGIYRLTNMLNGKMYIGISQNIHYRLKQHANLKKKSKLANALSKYGPANFLLEPLFYCLSDATADQFLPELEAALIAEYDAISNGYNVLAATGRVGPYGEEFGNIIKAAHARKTPEERSAILRKSNASMTREQRQERSRNNALKQGQQVLSDRMKSMRDNQTPERRKEIASQAGKASALVVALTITQEKRKEIAKKSRASFIANHSPEERRAIYKKTGIAKLSSEQLSQNGKKGVAIINANRTPERAKAISVKGYASRTPEQRREFALKGAAAAKLVLAKKSAEERSAIAKKIWESRRANGTDINPTMQKSKWANNGKDKKRFPENMPLPEGWAYGYLPPRKKT